MKRLPEFPEIMDKANQALSMLAEGKVSPNSNSFNSLKIKEMKMKSFKNNLIIGFLTLVIILLLVF